MANCCRLTFHIGWGKEKDNLGEGKDILGGVRMNILETDLDWGRERECDAEEPGRGEIGIETSTVLLYAGYPSHFLFDRRHLLH
jgi:hypothetical protein